MAKRTEVEDNAWRSYTAELANNLRRIRLAAALSQEDVAYRSGLTRYTYQKYEKGESAPGRPANPTIRTLLAIAQVLQVPLSDILPRDTPDLRLR
ncbi:helix-turn-helix transcriptional regulator [Cryobacterium sp. 10S3]|uniref:helix-turn-helix transcriptional regulator n=1 Tax=Cryobacterium sp. 10S3 TaxID=3048582 RepID=UPI002AC950AF|nr:helix-turn-helix transcriptional regulator [Cryobacterium sp. 10S3]MEB0287131.1 helix-turn-helix transcriptional regulator [Cryobacterium sp. 10S3]WPX12268.1 helix-turn-helix transcriptional regulator [Cryobacterium sp. 10S3]